MFQCWITVLLFCAVFGQRSLAASEGNSQVDMKDSKHFAIAVHGGAGTIERGQMTPEREKEFRDALEQAVRAGAAVLERDGSSLDAVEAAVRLLEDDPNFNAGRGAVFTSAGTNELDASIMDGKTLKAGAVASLTHIKNPVTLARLVMEKSPHVMLEGEGAEAFAKEHGIALVDPKYFFTQRRWDELQKDRKKTSEGQPSPTADRHGTVGAVALDQNGNLAAATSTGGTTNKRPGRVGDSPIIGAGTYASNATCAVSCTGDGEYFIRAAVAHEVSSLIENKGVSVKEAAEGALGRAAALGGTGGLIAMDAHGNVAMPFNTSGMYRAVLQPDGKVATDIYR